MAIETINQMVQQVWSSDKTWGTIGTNTIPIDDTIPQITEGNEYITATITPKNASNILLIETVLWFTCASAVGVTVALFQDSDADAIAANYHYDSTYLRSERLTHRRVAGSTSPITFKVRVGGTAAANIYKNGNASSRLLGGIGESYINIMEIAQ